MSELFEMINQEANEERFVIDSDAKAEWAMRKIAERDKEAKRIVSACIEMIAYYQDKMHAETEKAEKDNANLLFLLQQYFNTVDVKSTKTQSTYKLPSGKLKLKHQSSKIINMDDDKIGAQFHEYVELVPKLKWGELKKRLTISDGNVIDTVTGEIVEGAEAVNVPEKFVIEVEDEQR